MKISKKVVVSALSTTMAVAFVAALTGTVAWYQFNTRVSTTTIGTNVADTGVLQISTDKVNWGRDLVTADLITSRVELTPVTFGALNADGSLPSQAYMKPDASNNGYDGPFPGSYSQVYQFAEPNQDYIRYQVYIRALEVNNVSTGVESAAKDVFLSDITFEDVDGAIASGLRAHIAIDQNGDGKDDKYILLSKDGVTDLQLSGVLDLDGNGHADHVGGPEWNANREDLVIYGNPGDVQNADSVSDWKVTRSPSDGSIDAVANASKKLFTTGENDVRVTVNLWMEGWDTSVGEKEIEMDRLAYREVKVDDATGYYTYSSGNYNKVTSGKAQDAYTYYMVNASLIDPAIPNGNALPENAYRLEGENYVHQSGNSDGGDYYNLNPLVADLVTPSDLESKLPGLYELTNSGEHIKTVDTQVTDSNKIYYSLINKESSVEYSVTDPDITNDISRSHATSDYYVKDTLNNYVKSSTYNVHGTQYWQFTPVAFNPTLTDMEDGFVAASEMTSLNIYTVNGSGEYTRAETANAQGTEYWKVPASDPELSKFADDSFDIPETWYKYDGANYVPVSVDEWNDSSETYYIDALGNTAASLSDLANDTFDVPSGWYKDNGADGFELVGTEKNNNSLSYYTAVSPTAASLSDLPSGSYTIPTGWYTHDGENFVDASGTNVQGTTYYTTNDLGAVATLANLSDGAFTVPNTWYKDGTSGYDKVGAAEASVSTETYYTAIASTDATLSDLANHSFVCPETWYKDDGLGGYVQVTHHEKNVHGKNYYLNDSGLLAHMSDLGDGAVNLSNYDEHLYTYDSGSKTYSPATGTNVSATDYHVLNISRYNNQLTDLPNGIVKAAKLESKNLYKLNAPDYKIVHEDSVWGTYYFTLSDVETDSEFNNARTGTTNLVGLGMPDRYVLDGDGHYILVNNQSRNNIKGTTYYNLTSYGVAEHVPMWSGEHTDGAQFRFGLTFDVGKTAFDHPNP